MFAILNLLKNKIQSWISNDTLLKHQNELECTGNIIPNISIKLLR